MSSACLCKECSWSLPLQLFLDNLKCEGEDKYEQKVSCHYEDHEKCGPPAKLILQYRNIQNSAGSGKGEDELCTCKFRGGQRVCDDSKSILYISVSWLYSECTALCTEDSGMGVNPALVLHIASLLILTVFVIEVRGLAI